MGDMMMQLDVTHHLLSLRTIVVFTKVSLGRIHNFTHSLYIRMPSNLFSLNSQASNDAEFDGVDSEAIGLVQSWRLVSRSVFFVAEVSAVVAFCCHHYFTFRMRSDRLSNMSEASIDTDFDEEDSDAVGLGQSWRLVSESVFSSRSKCFVAFCCRRYFTFRL